MTGLHYKIVEAKPTAQWRVFKIKRAIDSDFTLVYFDHDGQTHCGDCKGGYYAMGRNCVHCRVIRRHLGIAR